MRSLFSRSKDITFGEILYLVAFYREALIQAKPSSTS